MKMILKMLLGKKAAPAAKPVLTFTRDSIAYDFNKTELPVDSPALEPFQIPVNAFEPVDNVYPAAGFDPAMDAWSYDEAISEIKAFANRYATEGWVYENLCDTYEALQSGLEHPTLLFNADSGKPIFIMQNATHGNEKHSLPGLMAYLEEIMTSDRDEFVWARENLGFMIMGIQNPNGWNLDRRRNGTDTSSVFTGVNLNRNWDYFWEYAADPDKGSEPFSEIENRNFRSWLEKNDRIKNGVLFLDFHSWWSRTIYGMLTDHNFNHGMKIQTLQRSIWRYSNFLIQNRDWSGYTLNGGLDNLVFSERSSTRKPYAPYWGQQRMQKFKGYCCQFEIPQGSESQAVNAQVILDALTGCTMALRDHLQNAMVGIKIDKAVLDTDILNPNSLLTGWSDTYNRPQYFRSEGVVLVSNGERVDVHRPLSAAWPRATFDSASCVYIHPTDETKSFFVVAGGEIEGNVETTAVYLEMMVPAVPPPIGSNEYGIYKPERAQVKIDSLPEAIKNGAMTYCNGYIYHFFGHKGAQGYELNIYRLPVTTASDDVAAEMDAKQWELVKSTSHYVNGLQRHRVVAVGTDILIIGGRGSDDYYRDIVKFDTTDFSETLVGQVGYKNGWFGIERIPTTDTFIYFGGWAGASTKDDVFKMDLTDVNAPVITRLASMPVALRTFVWGLDEENNALYVISGESAEDTWSTDAYVYDLTTDTWVTLTQTDDGAGTNEYSYSKELDDEEETFDIANVNLGRAAMSYNPYTRTLNIIAGERDDGTGSAPTITFFEFNVDELALSARKVNDVTWGTFKPSTSRAITNGHLSTVVASVRNEMQWTDPDELKVNPYVRSLNYVGPTWSQTTRWRHKYLVAPRLVDVAVPCYAPEPLLNNSKIYAYFRLYGEGTKVSLAGLQMIDNKLLTPRLVPETGMSAERAIFAVDPRQEEIRGAFFSPLNERFSEDLQVAKFTGTNFILYLEHRFSDDNAKGVISARVTDTDGNAVADYDILTFITNYDLYTNMYKRDVINFRIENRYDAEVEVWVYGLRHVVDIPEIGRGFKCTSIEANPDNDSRVGIGFYLHEAIII